MKSLSVVNGNTFIIGNGGSSGARTLTLGKSRTFTNALSGVINDLIYLSGASSLTIQPSVNSGTQTLSLVLAQSGNFSVGSIASLHIASAISGVNTASPKPALEP